MRTKTKPGQASAAQISYLNGLRSKFGLPPTRKVNAAAVGKELERLQTRYALECEVPRLRQALEAAASMDDDSWRREFVGAVLYRPAHAVTCEFCGGDGCPACVFYDKQLTA